MDRTHRRWPRRTFDLVGFAGLTLVLFPGLTSGQSEQITPGTALAAFRAPKGHWAEVGAVSLKDGDPTRLVSEVGQGIVANDPPGRTWNLITTADFADVEVHLEYLVPRGSNSGIKLMGLYEIQLYDSYGIDRATGSDNGGVYPRAELLPKYRHIDEGVAPRVNASRPPGEWQELELVFRAPRFDAGGKKLENARFERVVLNGQLIHADLEVLYPTGHAWDMKPEIPRGPIFLQGDHGPVAFRSLRVRAIVPGPAAAP